MEENLYFADQKQNFCYIDIESGLKELINKPRDTIVCCWRRFFRRMSHGLNGWENYYDKVSGSGMHALNEKLHATV